MALERSFTSVLTVKQVSKKKGSTSSELTYRMCRARCSLRVKLRLHGGKSVQKKRWPFFFLEGRFESLLTLSLSDPSFSSSSPSPICTSCECDDLCESSLLCSLLLEAEGVSLSSRAGDDGSGRWPASPAKVLRVGVLADGSSARISSLALGSVKKLLLGRGVVGVVSSIWRPGGGSGTVSVVLTAWKVDMVQGRVAGSPGGARLGTAWCLVYCAGVW